MLTFYRDKRPSSVSGPYVWNLRVIECALHTALPHDVVPRTFNMLDYTRKCAYKHDKIRPAPEGWVPYDLDGFPRPVKIAPRSARPTRVRFDYKPPELENDVERINSENDQDGQRPLHVEQDIERTSPGIDENEQGLPDLKRWLQNVENIPCESDQHGNRLANLEDLHNSDSGDLTPLGGELSNIDGQLQQDESDVHGRRTEIAHRASRASTATEQSCLDRVHRDTTSSIASDYILVNTIVEIGRE